MHLTEKNDITWISKHRQKLNMRVTKRTVYTKEFIDQLHALMLSGKTNAEIKEIMNLESSQKTYNLFAVHRRMLKKQLEESN